MAAEPSQLQRELHQRKPFASPSHEAVVGLLRTADILRQRMTAVVEPHGITPQQYNVLRILRGAEPEGLPTLEVAERMIERAPGITRLLDRLEQKDLVRRTRSDSDRRQVFCRITASGLELLRHLDQPVLALHALVTARLSSADQHRLIDILDTLREPAPTAIAAGRARANPTQRKEKSP